MPAGRQTAAGSLTCGAPGNSRAPAPEVRTRGRASAGHSTGSSRVGAARRAQVPTLAGTQPRAGDSARGRSRSAVAWATAPLARVPAPAPPGRLPRGGAGSPPIPRSQPGRRPCSPALAVSERRSGLRSCFPARDLQTGVAILSTCCPVRVRGLNAG